MVMIEYRSVLDELGRLDELHRERLCADCADSPEARCSKWRLAFESAAERGDAGFMRCANCGVRWIPAADIDRAVIGWSMILSENRLVATLCAACMASDPEPARLPNIARRILARSRGPIQ
jgi:hypothetical protein